MKEYFSNLNPESKGLRFVFIVIAPVVGTLIILKSIEEYGPKKTVAIASGGAIAFLGSMLALDRMREYGERLSILEV